MESGRPNVLIFMTDHQRYDMAPPFRVCKTPNLDRMARESVLFTNMFCPSPHCCPSRATFFSGLYPSDHGVWNNVNVGNTLSRGLAKGVRLWSEDLAEEGVKLYFSGKWHVSAEEGPQDRGFVNVYHKARYTGVLSADETRVPDCSEWRSHYRIDSICDVDSPRQEAEIKRPGYPRYKLYGTKDNPFGDEDVIGASVAHIREVLPRETAPWLFYVGNLGPHDPYFVPQRFIDMYDINDIQLPPNYRDNLLDKPALYQKTQSFFSQLTDAEHREAIRHYLAFCTYEDHLFGRLVDALRETGQYDDTIIVYCSDHGDYVGAHGLWTKGLPCFQEAYRVPMVVMMPGRTEPCEVRDRASLADIAPTLLELYGVPAGRRFAGRSLCGYLRGETQGDTPAYTFTQSNGNELYGIQRSIASDEWKYVFNGFDYDELYDLRNDPLELTNLARDKRYAGVIRDMTTELWRFAKANHDTYINPYIMIAHMPYGPGIIGDELFE